jgi:phage terminase large subunit
MSDPSVLDALPLAAANLRLRRSGRAVDPLALRAQLVPSFINEQQRAFFDSEAPEVLYSGAFRAGKSRIGCEKAYFLARCYPGIPIGIFRKIAADLEASTQTTLFGDVIPPGAVVRGNDTLRRYELANGSVIRLFGLDANTITGLPSKVGSVELGWAFVDEATELSEDDWNMVKGRLSWPGIGYHQIAAATNPAGPTHWLKRRFTPPSPTRVYLHASTFDNPSLPADYVAEAAAAPDDFRKRRYTYGEWVGADGAIWNLPDDQIADADGPFKAVVGAIDWGFVHAFAAEIIGQSGSGRLAVIDEVYTRGRTLDELIPALLELQARHGVLVWFADPSEPAYILACRRAGLRVEEADNSLDPGLQAVTRAIAAGMTVAPRCAGLLGEIPGYVWAKDRAGGFRDRPIEINDDACDALRYGVMAFEPASVEPPQIVTYEERVHISPY